MALNRYDKYGLTLNATQIGGVTAQNVMLDPVVRGEPTSGSIHTALVNMIAQAPRAAVTSLNVAALLAVVGQFGYRATGAGIKLYAQKHAAGGTRAGVASHKSWTIAAQPTADGMVIPRRLSVQHGGDATLDMEIIATCGTDDDTVHPVVIGEGVSLPTVTDAERYALGPVTLGSVALDSITGFELDFGLSVEALGSDGKLYPKFISVVQARPTFTLRGLNPQWVKDSGAIPMLGKALEHADTKLYLRKRSDGGTFVADGTAQHIKITAAGLAYSSEIFNAATGAAETALTIMCKHDGTNNPIVINTASAIT